MHYNFQVPLLGLPHSYEVVSPQVENCIFQSSYFRLDPPQEDVRYEACSIHSRPLYDPGPGSPKLIVRSDESSDYRSWRGPTDYPEHPRALWAPRGFWKRPRCMLLQPCSPVAPDIRLTHFVPIPFDYHSSRLSPFSTETKERSLGCMCSHYSLTSSDSSSVDMAHDTSNASSPVSDPLPVNDHPPFSLPEDIPSSISEGHKAMEDGLPFKHRQSTSKDLQDKTASSAASGEKTVKRPEEWKVPPPKRLARVINAHAKIVSPSVQRLDKPGKSKPTPDEFRSTGRDGASLDPALSADEEDVNVADKEDTGSRSSALINKMKSLIKETPKKALKKKTANKSNPLRLGSMDVDPPVTDKHQASTHARGGSMPLTKFDSQGLKSSSAGQKTPKDKMPAERSDKMNIDPPALARLKATFAIPAASTANQLHEPAANPSTPARMENVNKYPAGLTRGGPETTPGNPGHLTRTPSTVTTISNSVLPNLAKASLADMKAMRGIWIRDKENAAANVSELRRAGHHLIAPAAYEYQD
ncbi:hypothetical protein PGT21_001172 [Puccinia graminis f. sp. tritici]|uniref:Uncharacterized protein n=1 Tax=Puccinia graminis f. sp. tritici TaxID=56615 RepID=A0A5B0PCX5_PUCGR|nr:hypothetical protein PGT21_001172 [Puccinia graminis f. sp. tritici]